MSPTSASGYLHQAPTLRLLAVMVLVLLPHGFYQPMSINAGVLAVIVWRVWAAYKRWPMPSRALKVSITLLTFAGIYLNFGRVTGQHAGVALLLSMCALKLTEMQNRRDVMVVVFLLYFLCASHFLFSQEIWTLIYLLFSSVAITAVLIESNHAGAPLPPTETLRTAAVLIGQALPVMVALFILFPRVPGPLWGLPSDAGAARSGLPERMAPGDISTLILSDALAFRVRFIGTAPEQRYLYWRGPVFWQFDGRTWTPGPVQTQGAPVQLLGKGQEYEMVLEPTRTRWLFALDLADPRALPQQSEMAADGTLLAANVVKERLLYVARSHPQYLWQTALPNAMRASALQLPADRNPRAIALGQAWRQQGLADRAIVDKALRLFSEQAFYYTLKPPPLGAEPVDDFLFNTRRGFCEHYASAFSVLMRAAGIPTRVVTGYQGGTPSLVGDYYSITQANAHAWTEVWLPERGWKRVDPTAAVAPERVERDLNAALSNEDRASLDLPNTGTLLLSVKAHWDFANAEWNRWFLAYGPSMQAELLSKVGIVGWQNLMLAALAALSLLIGIAGAWAWYRATPQIAPDPILRLWQRAIAPLAKHGLRPYPHESVSDFAQRVAIALPQLAPQMHDFANKFLAARYLPQINAAQVFTDLHNAARAFRADSTALMPTKL